MVDLALSDLRLIKNGRLEASDKSQRSFTNVSIDSRTVKAGEIFFAIKGERFDGHTFIPEAINKGIDTFVVNNNWRPDAEHPDKNLIFLSVPDTNLALRELALLHRKKFDIPVIGITGTNGKTTTKELVADVLSQKYKVLKSEGNFNNLYGLPLTLFNLKRDVEAVVVEMGASIPGEIAELCKIALPTHGIITNIGKGHIEFFKTIEEVANTKTALLRAVSKIGFINGDDQYLAPFRTPGKVMSFGLNADNDLYPASLKMQKTACYSFSVENLPEFHLQVPGKISVYNALAALSIGLEIGLPNEELENALNAFTGYAQRLEIKEWRNSIIINDSYNANPDSVKEAINLLEEYQTDGRKWAVLGDMLELGENSEYEHGAIGEVIGKSTLDEVITVGTESRLITEAAKKFDSVNTFHAVNHSEAGEILINELKKGDVVLLKGSRGSKMELVLEYLLENRG